MPSSALAVHGRLAVARNNPTAEIDKIEYTNP
jgi:hypothetical protein